MKIGFLVAAAILSTAIATPTMAQVITFNAGTTTSPEYCFPNYANDVCDREGYSRFYTGTGALAFVPPAAVADNSASCAKRYRSFDPASGTYLGRDKLRHPCQ
jgi:hypothetical protein